MNSRKLEIDDHINSTLEKIKNEYIRISKWLYDEELKMREDLEEMADPGEMERQGSTDRKVDPSWRSVDPCGKAYGTFHGSCRSPN